MPVSASDADGDSLTVTLRNLPAGAAFNAATGVLSWTPTYDQAGVYENITVIVSDGKTTVNETFNITVEQGYLKPKLTPIPSQTLREGDRFALQLAGSMPGGLVQADGTSITLSYSAPWLPGGASLNSETGWFEWTPGYSSAGTYRMPITVTATYNQLPPGSLPDKGGLGWVGEGGDGVQPVTTSVTGELLMQVLNANGTPQFDPAETWNILEGQPLRISLFAFDPDNADFEPKVRLSPGSPATGPDTTAPTVSYQVNGLPEGATFDSETMELVWTPGYRQAGTYYVNVIATDDGDGTGMPKSSQITVPIVVRNANRAPEIADITNAFVDKGSVIEIPVSAADADGNPLQLTFFGLPRFATYTQNPSGNGAASGVIRFAPGEGDRGDYTITVIAQDDGEGDVNQTMTQSRSFVLTVRSATEAPVISVPRQVVVLAGQALSLPIAVSDADQDALNFSAQGLPAGATLTPQILYGQALLAWAPTADDIGTYDISIQVADSGLGPQDAGYVQDPNAIITPNITVQTVRVIVRDANAAPELLGVQITGQMTEGGQQIAGGSTTTQITASEGVPLSIEIFARDTDLDQLNWSVTGLPRGMQVGGQTTEDGGQISGNSKLLLNWTPDYFAALPSTAGGRGAGGEGGSDGTGVYTFTVTASDGIATVQQTFEVTVTNTNQAPKILPMPLQLVNEGDTVSFTVLAADPTATRLACALLHDANTPAGISFDPSTGYFEWTPDQDAVNNATLPSDGTTSHSTSPSNNAGQVAGYPSGGGAGGEGVPYTFTFTANDGTTTTIRTVQVRVFDVNRVPQITVSNHAVVVGQTLSLPVQMSGNSTSSPDGTQWNPGTTPSGQGTGILVNDPDGQAQTQALTISFTGLPEGASYDAQYPHPNPPPEGEGTNVAQGAAQTLGCLNWTPGPGQVGDYTITAHAFDGKNTTSQTFVLRVTSDAAANAPKVLISTTPSLPALPGQTVLATVRADGYSAIQTLSVQVRGTALLIPDSRSLIPDWQTIALDNMGRLRLTPTQPGLIEIRVTAIDQDGFSTTQTHTVAVRDPADTTAPLLAWSGAFQGATATSEPITVNTLTALQAAIQEQQLMGYKLQIAPSLPSTIGGGAGGGGAWSTLGEQTFAAENIAQQAALLQSIDPALLHNGVYTLRLSAWDLQGRTGEIEARIVIDTAQKTYDSISATDAIYTLAGHDFALTRTLEATPFPTLPPAGEGLAFPLPSGEGSREGADFGNWAIPALDTHITTDQPRVDEMGATAPWQSGARVWLQIPANLSDTSAAMQNLSFTLSTTSERLGNTPGAPLVYHPVFTSSQGWTLEAHNTPSPLTGESGGEGAFADSLQRIGSYLYDNNTGLPWVPESYALTSADGTRYELDAAGKVTGVTFTDGVQWLVTDAGIAAISPLPQAGEGQGERAVGADERVDFLRDDKGRIIRITGPAATAGGVEDTATAYKYDTQGRLILARSLDASMFTSYAYDAQGKPHTDTITANFGAAVNWASGINANQWQGDLQAAQTTTLAFAIRDSEIASTVHTPGAQGAVIVAIETTGDAALEITGATILSSIPSPAGGGITNDLAGVVGQPSQMASSSSEGQGERVTTLVRITEAGIKLIRLTGTGTAQVKVSLAGDINRDGLVNGTDSQAWEAMLAASNSEPSTSGGGQGRGRL